METVYYSWLLVCINQDSVKVEMGIMEAQFENTQRVLQADMNSAMEKQVSHSDRRYKSAMVWWRCYIGLPRQISIQRL